MNKHQNTSIYMRFGKKLEHLIILNEASIELETRNEHIRDVLTPMCIYKHPLLKYIVTYFEMIEKSQENFICTSSHPICTQNLFTKNHFSVACM